MTTLSDFIPSEIPTIHEDPRERLLRLSTQAGMRQVALDLEDEISMIKKGIQVQDHTFRAGQEVWWFPSSFNRPSFMIKTQVMVAAMVKSMNQERGTVLIEHWDERRTALTFLVPATELVRREIPR